ncbi:MAG: hypothetical protein LBT99_00455 [Bifidobacteriaceae bacterium]|jgi:hypothetical protein|nr:hypothetical protein [Bifidobacteriaceae bacterium]
MKIYTNDLIKNWLSPNGSLPVTASDSHKCSQTKDSLSQLLDEAKQKGLILYDSNIPI